MRMNLIRGAVAAVALLTAGVASATTYPPCTAQRQDECRQAQPGARHHAERWEHHAMRRAR